MKLKRINSTSLVFEDYIVTYEHQVDSDENIYLDFEYLNNYVHTSKNSSAETVDSIGLYETEFDRPIMYKILPNIGIALVDKYGNEFKIPCYKEHGGFSGGEISLVMIEKGSLRKEIFHLKEAFQELKR